MESFLDDWKVKAICDIHHNSDVMFFLKYGHAENAVVFDEKGKSYFINNVSGKDFIGICSVIKLCKDKSVDELIQSNVVKRISRPDKLIERLLSSGSTLVFWLKFNEGYCDISYYDSVCLIGESIENYVLLSNTLKQLLKIKLTNEIRLKYVIKEFYYSREDNNVF